MKRIIAIGGGELKERTTLAIDEYVAKLAKEAAGERRANALFIPTASHDFMPYYNTFHKVYTGVFDIKTDVLLSVFKEPDIEKWRGKKAFFQESFSLQKTLKFKILLKKKPKNSIIILRINMR